MAGCATNARKRKTRTKHETLSSEKVQAMKAGFYRMSNEAYHEAEGLSKSSLSRIAKAPAVWKYWRETTRKPPSSPALVTGTLVHLSVLEPELYAEGVVVAPNRVLTSNKQRRGKKWEDFVEAHPGKIVTDEATFCTVRDMTDAVRAHPLYDKLLTNGVAELSGFWQVEDPHDFDAEPIWLKIRPDYLPGAPVAVDLKTTVDASEREFTRSAARFKYHWSAALTTMGLSALTGGEHTEYVFFCVEKEPPHLTRVYTMSRDRSPDTFDVAERELWYALGEYSSAKRNGFPGYPTTASELRLPRWYTAHTERG